MNEDQDNLSIPGWDRLIDAGRVAPPSTAVLMATQVKVRSALTAESAAKQTETPRLGWRRRAPLVLTAAASLAIAVPLGSWLLLGQNSPVGPPGAAEDPGVTGCAESYTAQTLARRGVAFDGTVVRVAEAKNADARYAAVTLTVNQWFRGGSADTITVAMVRSTSRSTSGHDSTAAGVVDGESAPAHAIGTRLLVSGAIEPRALPGAAEVVAFACGFTRAYDPVTATTWTATFAPGGLGTPR